MRRVKSTIYVREDGKGYVPKEIEGVFHQWGVNHEEYESGAGNYTTAIIELDDGTVVESSPSDVKFLDKFEGGK